MNAYEAGAGRGGWGCRVGSARGFCVGVAAAAVLAAAGPVAADVHVVAAGESIQGAIDAAASGDVIYVMPGEYAEHVRIEDKEVALRSVGGAEVTTIVLTGVEGSAASGIAVVGDSGGTSVEGFAFERGTSTIQWAMVSDADVTVRGCGFTMAPGIQTMAGAGLTVSDSSFVDCVWAIDPGGDVVIERCEFVRCSSAVRGSATVCSGGEALVRGCDFEDCFSSVELPVDVLTVVNSRFERCTRGVLALCAAVTVQRCWFMDVSSLAMRSQGETTVEDCVFTATTSRRGSEISIAGDDPVVIQRCYFQGLSGRRGVVDVNASSFELPDCAFIQNSGSPVSARVTSAEPVVIRGCDFIENNSFREALWLQTPGAIVVSDCDFVGNDTVLRAIGGQGSVVERCRVVANESTGIELIYAPNLLVHDCLFEGNRIGPTRGLNAGEWRSCRFLGNTGGAFLLGGQRVDNCLFVGNQGSVTSPFVVGATFVENVDLRINASLLSSSIVRASAAPLGQPLINATTRYCNLQDGPMGTGDIDAAPLFVQHPSPGSDGVWGTEDDYYGDLRLRTGSPCIDAGDNTAFAQDVTLDLGGSPRFVDDPATPDTGLPDGQMRAVADIGAFEFQPDAPPPCPCDYDGDGQVADVDLLVYLDLWFAGAAAAEWTGDEAVDVVDLLEFLSCFFAARADPGAC